MNSQEGKELLRLGCAMEKRKKRMEPSRAHLDKKEKKSTDRGWKLK